FFSTHNFVKPESSGSSHGRENSLKVSFTKPRERTKRSCRKPQQDFSDDFIRKVRQRRLRWRYRRRQQRLPVRLVIMMRLRHNNLKRRSKLVGFRRQKGLA
ncbi:hypothetical protein PIB30_093505, partial [Stylosanthes scabra]|nr:hypothetical protein [Stylosanthes scabra]